MNFLDKFKPYEIENFGYVRLPEVSLDDNTKRKFNLSESASNLEILKKLAYAGYERKKDFFDKSKFDKYEKQLKFELDLVEELGFTDYFLLVWMVINKARDLGAFIDYGRGSAAASLIFYLLGITGVDPISKNLIFARFISKVRAKKQVRDGITYLWGDLAPDVDLNLGGVREEIVEWLKGLYKGKIAKISAIGTLTGKALIKDVYKKVSNASEEEAKFVADMVERHAGIVEDIKDIPVKHSGFKQWTEQHPKAYSIALKLRNLIRQKTSHASGYLISYSPLDGFIPLELNRDKELTTSYEMDDVANFAIKLDLLGLTNNEIVKDILELVPEPIEEINKKLDDDPIIYDQFQHGKLLPYGLYQINADCTYGAVNAVKAKNIMELSDVNAIARPGALDYLKGYVENETPCPHPVFTEILSWTRNYCLYQEQMMRMAEAVGFTPDEAELLRRVVGKKKVDEVKEWKERIYQNVEKSKLPKEVGDMLWKILDDSSKYSFNLSHSLATAYLGALTVYLKYKYPLQYYYACLKATKKCQNPIEEISKIQIELRQFNISLLPPHILNSDLDFKIEGNNIRFGLGQIKGIAEKSIEKLNRFKSVYSNKFEIFSAANEAKISISILNSLIFVGALEMPGGKSRSYNVMEAQLWNLLTEKEKMACLEVGRDFDYDLCAVIRHLNKDKKDIKGKPIIKDSRCATIRRDFAPFREMYDFNRRNEKFASNFFENALLGFSYSSSLIDVFSPLVTKAPFLETIEKIKYFDLDTRVRFVGKILDVKRWKAKSGKDSLKYFVQDETGLITVLLFGESIDQHIENNGRLAEKDDIVVVFGNKKDDAVFGWEVGIQDSNIFLKISEMKKIKKNIDSEVKKQ